MQIILSIDPLLVSSIQNCLVSLERLRLASIDYMNRTLNNSSIGFTVFTSCHNILQDYTLRFGNNNSNSSMMRLQGTISSAFRIITQSFTSDKQIQISFDHQSFLKTQLASAYSVFYDISGNITSNTSNKVRTFLPYIIL